MARVTVTEERRGVWLTGRVESVTRPAARVGLNRLLSKARQFARIIAPVLTGRYRASLLYKTDLTDYGASGELYSTDNPEKVRIIEYGFPPARPDLRGRRPRLVFTQTAAHYERVLADAGEDILLEIKRGLD